MRLLALCLFCGLFASVAFSQDNAGKMKAEVSKDTMEKSSSESQTITDSPHKYTCKAADKTRIIEVKTDVPEMACAVTYDKPDEAPGGTQTLWTNNTDVTWCEEKAEMFMNRQKGWGFDCSAE